MINRVSIPMKNHLCILLAALALALECSTVYGEEPVNVSGVYPHLTMWNAEGECGTGAVVLWQGELWVITYAPHQPGGSSDKLYRIDEETQISKRDLLDKGYLARYVREREGYFYPIADHQYRRVVRMSIGQAREQYRQGFNQKNENAPINIYKDHARVDISLKSISFIEKGVAQVRFIATVIDADSEERHHRIATVHYDYEPAATIPLSVLADNALGFAVSEYRSSAGKSFERSKTAWATTTAFW